MRDRKPAPLVPFTFSASLSRLLKPVSANMKRMGKLKVSPRTIGKILETPSGTKLMIVEQGGRDIWRGKHKSLNEAIIAGHAGLGVDRILLQRSKLYGVANVMIVVEEIGRIFVISVDSLLDDPAGITRQNWQGRAYRILPWQNYSTMYLGAHLIQKRKRASV